MEEHIVRWLRDNDALVCIAGGVVLVVGSVRDWDWLCDPVGKPHMPFSRGTLRLSVFLCGCVLVACGVLGLVLVLAR